ncbi:MAG: glycerate kinase [Nitriliruptoraceae bacterium]
MRILIAPDGFKGTLDAATAADAIAEGWRAARPDDDLVLLPLSDGGDGLAAVLAGPDDRWTEHEVVGPTGRPVTARLLHRSDGLAVVESAQACGLHLVPTEQRDPLTTTTYGVGQLLLAAVEAGARHLLLGLGGSATVDAGLGALTALGFRPRLADGAGLKIGGGELVDLDRVEHGWAPELTDVEVELLADVTTPLGDAARVFGPQKGADEAAVARLAAGLARAAEVLERDLGGGRQWHTLPGTGAAGGLGFGFAIALGGRFVPGATRVAELVGLPQELGRADLVLTGEGRLDATSSAGKVVGYVRAQAAEQGIPVAVVAGQVAEEAADPASVGLEDLEVASPGGPGPDPAREVLAAAARLASRW